MVEGRLSSIGMRAESSLFLQADLTANTVRITNKVLFIIKGFQILMRRCRVGRGHAFSHREVLY